MSLSSVFDRRLDISPHKDTATKVVSDDIPDGHVQRRNIIAFLAADTRYQGLQNNLDNGTQDTQRDGQSGCS